MDPAEVSRRLKAARWLAGGVDDNGRPKAMTVAELVALPILAEARIAKSRIEELEQTVAQYPIRSFESDAIERALNLPSWFAEDREAARRADALDLLARALGDLGLAQRPSPEEEPSGAPGTDRPEGAEGGAGA